MHRLLQLRARLPLRYSETGAGVRADDEVRHVLRPDIDREAAYVRPEEIARRREKPVNSFWFGLQKVTTQVYMMAPAERDEISVDVVDYMYEGEAEYV